jgi:uncharacterized integral membrane protein
VRVTTVLIVIPVVLLAAIIAVANRQAVTFSLDPFSATFPAISFTLPLYGLVFLTFLLGVLLGGATATFRRTRRRRVPDLTPLPEDTLVRPEPPPRRETAPAP